MKRLRLIASLLLAVWAAWAVPARSACAAAPAFSFQLGSRSASAEDVVALNVQVSPGAAIAGFRLRVSFDASVLHFVGTSASQQIEPETLQTNPDSDPVCSVYVCNVNRGFAPQLSGTVVTYLFQVKKGVSPGTTNLCACVDETCDYSAKDLYLDTYSTLALNILQPSSGKACLTGLEPSQGELEPAFSPDVYSYRLRVGSAVSSVTFQANAAEGAGVKVSRKSLLAAGSDTLVTVTVTSADKKSQTAYCVTVSRAAKESASRTVSEKNSSSKKKIAGKTLLPGKSRSSGANAAERALAAARKGTKATSKTGKTTVSGISAQQAMGQAAAAAPLSTSGPASLTVVRSQMPSYMVGMLATGFCIVTGILLSVWFNLKKK